MPGGVTNEHYFCALRKKRTKRVKLGWKSIEFDPFGSSPSAIQPWSFMRRIFSVTRSAKATPLYRKRRCLFTPEVYCGDNYSCVKNLSPPTGSSDTGWYALIFSLAQSIAIVSCWQTQKSRNGNWQFKEWSRLGWHLTLKDIITKLSKLQPIKWFTKPPNTKSEMPQQHVIQCILVMTSFSMLVTYCFSATILKKMPFKSDPFDLCNDHY